MKLPRQPLRGCNISKTSFFSSIMNAKIMGFPINPYLCNKPFSASKNTLIASRVDSLFPSIQQVLGVGTGPKIAKSVISGNPVDMVNYERKLAIGIQPRQSMSEMLFAVNADSNVTLSVQTARNSASFGSITSGYKVCKYTRLRAIVQDRFKVFLGKHGYEPRLGSVRFKAPDGYRGRLFGLQGLDAGVV
jgi:hypothetical protein